MAHTASTASAAGTAIKPSSCPIGTGEPPAISDVENICTRVLEGGRASEDELVALLEIQPGSEQARVLADAEDVLVRRGNKGRGYVYGQIGIDANPCPGNCQFCSFARSNAQGRGRSEASFDQVLHASELFAANGVHLISIMSSAAYRFDRYLELIARVRAVIGDDVALMANTRDLTLDEARSLAEAGANSIYHAVRLGEGCITDLDEQTRWQTLRNARTAGMDVATAVGPLYQPVSPDSPYYQTKGDIVEHMIRAIECKPFCSGVTGLHAVPGTAMEHVRPWPDEKMRVIAGVFQLAARGTIPYGGCQSVRWVDAGLDPRERGYGSEDERLVKRIRSLYCDLEADGWNVTPARM